MLQVSLGSFCITRKNLTQPSAVRVDLHKAVLGTELNARCV